MITDFVLDRKLVIVRCNEKSTNVLKIFRGGVLILAEVVIENTSKNSNQ